MRPALKKKLLAALGDETGRIVTIGQAILTEAGNSPPYDPITNETGSQITTG